MKTLEDYGLTVKAPPPIPKAPKLRTKLYERKLMRAERHLDGINTHINNNPKTCPLHGTDIHDKINDALQSVRGLIMILRNDTGDRQWTVTTRGGSNRHPELEWHFNIPGPKKGWKCICQGGGNHNAM